MIEKMTLKYYKTPEEKPSEVAKPSPPAPTPPPIPNVRVTG